VGKSTFLDILTGNLKPDGGEVIRGVTTKFGYFTQETITLNPANRLIEEVKEIAEFITLADGTQVSASKFLDNFLFPPEKQYNYISKLSGGEKKRLQLLKLLVTNPNFLILDEPTNDFDIDTLNVLEDYLDNFAGCLLLVSHDRYFMDHLVDQLFVFEGDGKIRLFNGNYTDYRDWVEEEEARGLDKKSSKPSVKETPPPAPQEKKKATFKEKQEFEKLQSEIEALEKQKSDIANRFTNGATDHQQLEQWSKEIKSISDSIDEKTLRWLELSELMQ
jgi:ATP-binding cassette subfamily F protein uup